MIQGLNITVLIQRREEGADDDVGGATFTTSTVARNVRARISNLKPTQEVRLQGLETSKAFNAHIWPPTIDVRESDIITPDNGPHAGNLFLVMGVQVSSLYDNDPRAHISLRMQRMERARTLQ